MSSLSICDFIGDVCFFKLIHGLVKHGKSSWFLLYCCRCQLCRDRYSKTVSQAFFMLNLAMYITDVTNETADWQWRHSTPLWKYLTLTRLLVSDKILTLESPNSFSAGAYTESDKVLCRESLAMTDSVRVCVCVCVHVSVCATHSFVKSHSKIWDLRIWYSY